MVSRTAIFCTLAAVLAGGPALGQSPKPLTRESLQAPNLPPVGGLGLPFGSDVPELGVAPGKPGDDVYLSDGSPVQLPAAKKQLIRFGPRYGTLGNVTREEIEPGTQRAIYTGGVIVTVTYTVERFGKDELVQYEFAADNIVVWIKGLGTRGLIDGVQVDATAPAESRMKVEMYLTGNVVIRSKDTQRNSTGGTQSTTRTLRAEQIYYDVENNRAIALDADLELAFDKVKDTVHVYGKEIQRLGRNEWRFQDAGAHASKLPSDPGIRLRASEFRYVESQRRKRNFLGIPYQTPFGDDEPTYERTLTGTNTRITIFDVPVFYTPYYRGDISEPLGPLQGIGSGSDRIFGFQFYTTWDLYKLLAVQAPVGHSWRLHADYLSDRGTAFGTDYDVGAKSLFGYGGPLSSVFRAYGLNDRGRDNIGNRGPEPKIFEDRFRVRWTYQQELFAEREPETFLPVGAQVNLQTQFAWISDKNFLEQYFYQEHAFGPNQETFAFLQASRGQFYGSVLAQGGQHRDWVSETLWLPKASGAVVGQSIFDTAIYDARASAGFAQNRPTTTPAFPVVSTDKRIDTGRFNLTQDLSVPLDVGPLKVTPYGTLDLTAYTEDLTGEQRGRIYGGGGVRTAIDFSHLYREASSELFNVKGLNHKVTLTGNYFNAESSVPFKQLPLLDRVWDDSLDLTYRSVNPYWQDYTNPTLGKALQTSPKFDPQRYAIRRLVDTRIDTKDDIQVVQLGVDQRLQTKRGYPGAEHTVDFVTLNLSGSLFPDRNRDNFGSSAAFLEYNLLWNMGDRTAFQSAGWFDPYDPGVKYFNAGVYLNRPDNTNFYVGYRQTDPVNSKAVIASMYYPLSKKYAVSTSVAYDFGIDQAISNNFSLIRVGKDMTISLGFNYNAIVNNFGFQFSILPNLATGTQYGRAVGTPTIGGTR